MENEHHEDSELNEEELDEASGGSIIVSGNPVANIKSRPHLNFSDLNPQPLPPGPPPDLNKMKNLGNLGSHQVSPVYFRV